MAQFRRLRPGQVSQIHVHDTVTGEDVIVHESRDVLFEAPNWSPSDDRLVLNGEGVLWTLEPEPGSLPQRVDHEGLPEINNDHVLDVDGKHIYLSAMDGHIYRASVSGGSVERITDDEGVWHFLHGLSPDGSRLAYVRMTSFDEPGRLAIFDVVRGFSTEVDTGGGHVDGPEWSPDGAWIYFNSERWATAPGHAQLARIPDGGGHVQRLHTSDTVDWFPHISPDGTSAVYLEFPTGTEGHPADRLVSLVVVAVERWGTARERMSLSGGQGTINVNSWAADSRRFAYVSYPLLG